jgi:hypothetical protein
MDISQGDLDIRDSLTIRGITGATSVAWGAGVIDKTFELVGDYNLSRSVDAADYVVWQEQNGQTGSGLAADGDDDGDVDDSDKAVRDAHFGNTLAVDGVVYS